jgi:hypothetical protein
VLIVKLKAERPGPPIKVNAENTLLGCVSRRHHVLDCPLIKWKVVASCIVWRDTRSAAKQSPSPGGETGRVEKGLPTRWCRSLSSMFETYPDSPPVCKRTGQRKRARGRKQPWSRRCFSWCMNGYLLHLLPGYLSVSARRITCMKRIYIIIIIKGETPGPQVPEQSSLAAPKKTGPVFATLTGTNHKSRTIVPTSLRPQPGARLSQLHSLPPV